MARARPEALIAFSVGTTSLSVRMATSSSWVWMKMTSIMSVFNLRRLRSTLERTERSEKS